MEQKKLGRKSGEGFYRWQDGKAQKNAAENIAAPADLEDRLILPLLNEAVAVIREGTVQDADLLDAGAVFATGFAPFRGGPLHYAKQRGIAEVVESSERACGSLRRALPPGCRLGTNFGLRAIRCEPLRGRCHRRVW